MNISIVLLGIFAVPVLQVIGFFIVICIVAYALWWVLTTVIIPGPGTTPVRTNLGYIIYVLLFALMFVWWTSYSFGLGIF